MTELDSRFRAADEIEVPDRWPEIQTRRPSQPHPSPSGKWVTTLVALLVGVVAVAVAMVAFSRPEHTTGAGATPIPVANGPIWAVGGGGEVGSLIYAVDPVTGKKTPLWSDGRNPYFPGFPVEPNHIAANYDYAFSPDGSRVAFAGGVDGGTKVCCIELFVMNADGSNLMQLTQDHGFNTYPSWSPDGSELVFSSFRGTDYVAGCPLTRSCPADLFVIGANGAGERRLTDDAADEATPAWSPDGSRIVYVHSDGSAPGEIWVVGADGAGAHDLIQSNGALTLFPRWSPDGTRILYLGANIGERFGVWVATADGADAREVIDTHADTTFGRPIWSPDGKAIAYADAQAAEAQLWIANADGSDPRMIAELPRYGLSPLTWQPRALQSGAGESP